MLFGLAFHLNIIIILCSKEGTSQRYNRCALKSMQRMQRRLYDTILEFPSSQNSSSSGPSVFTQALAFSFTGKILHQKLIPNSGRVQLHSPYCCSSGLRSLTSSLCSKHLRERIQSCYQYLWLIIFYYIAFVPFLKVFFLVWCSFFCLHISQVSDLQLF